MKFTKLYPRIDLIWHLSVKLNALYFRVSGYSFVVVTNRIDSFLVCIHYHDRRTHICDLLLLVWDAVWTDWVFLVAKHRVQVITRNYQYFKPCVVIVMCITGKLNRITSVPIDAEHTSLRVLPNIFKETDWWLFDWIEVIIIIISASMIR